jgi:hypothetical protein
MGPGPQEGVGMGENRRLSEALAAGARAAATLRSTVGRSLSGTGFDTNARMVLSPHPRIPERRKITARLSPLAGVSS